MILWYKNKGETPLRAINRLRIEKPELNEEILSYAGRLDPMAEGILPIIVGKEENKNRKDFLLKDKEYEAHFLLGCSTDTGDVLGLINNKNFKSIDENYIKKIFEDFINIKEQTYPWYSSKTVNGIALFEYARKSNFNIERPKRNIEIYSVSNIKIYKKDLENLIKDNIKDIKNVIGDFRQGEIIDSWNDLLDSRLRGNDEKKEENLQIVSCNLKVSSGTYIRTLNEYIEEKSGIPSVLIKLVRTKIF